MTPTEKALYMQHLFDIGDVVAIADTDSVGEITGLQVADGQEDLYRVLYIDATGSPHESWWRSSLLEGVDDDESNIIPFPCRCERAARNATRH